ncbi:MAG: TPR end-of-group domain-containing protein [Thermoanaerobaculia bacterium]
MIGVFLVLGMLAAPAPPAPAPAPAPTDFPVNTIVPRVECADTPGQSYALYLPPGYSRGRAWPILYLFDARSRGTLAAKLFSGPAARYKWIVASSNNTQSDGPIDPNITAFRAMWRDTHDRFSIDSNRVYAGGFSGGARVATLMGTTAPGTVAGVIGCGAGFHTTVRRKPPFVYFGTTGYRDFNYAEMRALGAQLEALGTPHRIEHFDGEHEWPPSEIALDAVQWMEVQAIRSSGTLGPSGELDEILSRRRERARALEARRPAEALSEYRSIERDFADLRDVSVTQADIVRLEHSGEVERDVAEEAKLDAQEKRTREAFVPVWAEIRSGDAIPLQRLVQELHIPELRERALKGPASGDGLSAQRLLNEISAQTSYYLATGYRSEKNHAREILCLSIAAQARPDSPIVFYRLAEARAVAGDREKALDDLAAAVEKGFSLPDVLEGDEDLSSVRSSPRFAALLAAVRARAQTKSES